MGRGGLLAIAALLAGCAVEVPYDLTWSLPLGAPRGAATVEVPLDLSQQPEVWSRRDQVEELRAEAVRLRIASVGPHNRSAVVAVALRYRSEGAAATGEGDVVLSETLSIPVTPGGEVEAAAPPELGPALLGSLQGTGRFTLVLTTSTEAALDATVEVSLSGSVRLEP